MSDPDTPINTTSNSQPTFESLWFQYRQQLSSFLHARIANADDAEDILQEVLLKSLQALPTLKSHTSIKPWLFQIANRTLIDFYRSRAKQRALMTEELWYQEQDPDIKQQLAQCLSPFIQQLPEDMAILLREVELLGKSQKQLAAEQGISYSTLKSRVHKGRQQLRQLYEDCCQFSLDTQGRILDCDSSSDSGSGSNSCDC
tara:strand:+ start:1775 stop:2377 length:603 start_codon:yes stop_codon:yes gene_type:complete